MGHGKRNETMRGKSVEVDDVSQRIRSLYGWGSPNGRLNLSPLTIHPSPSLLLPPALSLVWSRSVSGDRPAPRQQQQLPSAAKPKGGKSPLVPTRDSEHTRPANKPLSGRQGVRASS